MFQAERTDLSFSSVVFQAEKKALLVSVMNAMEDHEEMEPEPQQKEEVSVITPHQQQQQQQQPTDPASPTVATTPEPVPMAGGDTTSPKTADTEPEYEVNTQCSNYI